jgi:hypothetical protein
MNPNSPNGNENPAANDDRCPILRSQEIRSDAEGRVCLDDLWSIAGADANRQPDKWRRSAVAKRLSGALAQRIGRDPPNAGAISLVDHAGRSACLTFVHIVLAQAYAEYLDADLAVEVRKVFLRYRAADASLADDILERASLEDNRHTVARALGRVTRGQFTDVLKGHGVRQPWYAICTDAVYGTVLGKPAAALKSALGIPKSGSLRDAMTTTQLAAIALAESFSADRIQANDCQGGPQCKQETAAAARTVRAAMDAESRARRIIASPANDTGSEAA